MANYGYLYLRRKITPEVLEAKLRVAVQGWFGDRMKVERTPWDDDGPVWWVFIPNSAPPEDEALKFNKAPEDFGFPVALQSGGRTIAFRHARNAFDHWCQGCIEEQLSDAFGVGIFFDATDRTYKPGVRRYRCRRRFGLYVARNLKKPLSKEDQEFIERYFKFQTPEGWW